MFIAQDDDDDDDDDDDHHQIFHQVCRAVLAAYFKMRNFPPPQTSDLTSKTFTVVIIITSKSFPPPETYLQ